MIEVRHYRSATGEDLGNLLRGAYLTMGGVRVESDGIEQYDGVGDASITIGRSHLLLIGEPTEINGTQKILETKLLTKLEQVSHHGRNFSLN
ncbi:hypothetical protein A3K62_00740 [Candidatus Pacearchaeota archaeon RBG_16_35_8]|nr:MAG: hypothetical protein A3K62_00740 [Candidatus Pacearchaeota archaeon RBG_16_35_8]